MGVGQSYRRFYTNKEEKMIGRLNPGILILAFAGYVLAGCSTQTATKPEAPPSPSSSPSAQGSAKEKVVQASRETKSASSLEAHREGKAPVPSPLKEIYFDFDKYDLKADARAALAQNAAWLKANPSVRVEIEGHCDERGTSEYNLALGAKRAQAAKSYLESLGISAQRMSTISYGEELPVCREQTEACYQKNRRDRFVPLGARPTS